MMSKKHWIGILATVLIAVGLLTLALFTSHQQVTDDLIVRVGYKPNSGYQNYFVALTQQFFEKHGVTVEGTTFQSTNQMLQALAL